MATQIHDIETINPATGEVIEHLDQHTDTEIDAIVTAVAGVAPSWRRAGFERRSALMGRVAEVLRDNRDGYASTITREMGKTIGESRAEIEKCAITCEYYAENAERFLADVDAPADGSRSFVAHRPLGIVLAIMPWNFPFWQVFRFAAPGLMAGNVGLLKHSTNTSRCALEIESVFREAGLPEDAFRTLLIPAAKVQRVIEDDRVRAVTLTGSDATGAKVAAAAGAQIKKTVMELGGSDAFIVLEDADVAAAATTAVRARFQNAGQSCIAAKRFIAVEGVAEEFEERFATAAANLVVGDPTCDGSQMGPLARDDLRDEIERQLRESVQGGARVLAGGERGDGGGYFLTPTVLAGCTAETTAMREETFGPLAAVMRVPDAEAAVAAANASDYGLGANIWTRDVERGVALARRLDTGGVFINGMTHSHPALPFGGVKRSGYGRELADLGIREFVNAQTIWVGEGGTEPGGSPAAE